MRRLATAPLIRSLLAASLVWCMAAPAAAKSRITCYTCYDSDYFYIGVSVDKPSLRGVHSAPFSDPLADDAVAVFLQTGEAAPGAQRSSTSIEMAVSVAGGAQMYRGSAATPLKGFQDFLQSPDGSRLPFKYGVARRAGIGAAPSPDGGYVVEMAIPWLEIDGPPKVGQRMRFNVVALSAAPDTTPLISLSTATQSLASIQNPSLWGEIVFVDAPVRTVGTAPSARVSARVFTARPLMDGVLSPGEWNSLTSFGFAESGSSDTAPPAASAAAARVRPTVALAPPDQAIRQRDRVLLPAPARAPQPVPHLVLSQYRYDYQADPRKAAPAIPVQAADGSSLLADHPLTGCGPWLSHDNVDWHYAQLEGARQAGLDVLLPVYGAASRERRRYAQQGLNGMVSALKALASAGRDHPLIGLYLDTAALAEAPDAVVDARTAEGRTRLYAGIRDFFLQIPRQFRAAVSLTAANGGGQAGIVLLSSAANLAGIDSAAIDFCRARFRQDFGDDLLLLGDAAFTTAAGLDGYVAVTGGRGWARNADGWLKTVSLGPGAAVTDQSPAGQPVRRAEGAHYRENWRQALASGADWAFVDAWNDFRHGSEIAPSEEYGIQYVDITRAATIAFGGEVPLRATVLAHTIPSTAVAGGTWLVTARVANAGTRPWVPGSYAFSYRWARTAGGPFGDARIVPLVWTVAPGQAVTLSFPLRIPAEPGRSIVRLDLAEVNAKGDITAFFAGKGAGPADAPVLVVAPDDATAAQHAISVVASDLPVAVEAGSTYTARITVRNDGREPWRSASGRIAAQLLRAVSSINSTGEADALVPVAMAGASAPLPEDVAPGQVASINVPLTLSAPDGSPLPVWSPLDNWTYLIQWTYRTAAAPAEGGVSAPEALSIVEADFGAQINPGIAPPEMPAERRIPVRLSVRNAGPQTWRKDLTRIGYHWYYQDGTECVWEDETTPLPQDLAPGETLPTMLAWITAPPYDGAYWLVWDAKVGDTWASTGPGLRIRQAPARRVDVVRGRLRFVDLTPHFNADGVASDARPSDGSFSSEGLSLPSELVPPLTSTGIAATGLWHTAPGVGLESSRRYAFRWGSKVDADRNMIECRGQKLVLAANQKDAIPCRVVHLLAASTTDAVTIALTLKFADGSEQYSSFPVSRWDAAALNGEDDGIRVRYTRARNGAVLTDKPARVYRYALRTGDLRKLVAIQLPNAPQVKILAITAER